MELDRSMTDAIYDEVIVDKPWGHEYLMYRNRDVALWCLFLRRGERTSLHCHPRKKTGLVVLSGSLELRFLNNSTVLVPPANVMIRAGLFHQSAADLGSDVVLIEVESPVNKADLVRLDDTYGRQKTGYDSLVSTRPLDSTCLRLPEPALGPPRSWDFHGRQLGWHRHASAAPLIERLEPRDIVVLLEGGLFSDADEPILTAGDAVSANTLVRLSRAFDAPRGIVALVVANRSSD